jgi:branched-chain amino acid transport system ATP-binding protein
VTLGISHIPEGRRLFPYMTVLENLNLGAYVQNSKAEVDAVREEIFERFPNLKRRAGTRAGKLSGGEQEMLSVARGLMSKPRMLLMDEPCQGLSPIMVKEIGNTIRSINESGITILLVEHNVSIALGVADHVYILRNGGIVFEGSPDAFSADEFTKRIYLAG